MSLLCSLLFLSVSCVLPSWCRDPQFLVFVGAGIFLCFFLVRVSCWVYPDAWLREGCRNFARSRWYPTAFTCSKHEGAALAWGVKMSANGVSSGALFRGGSIEACVCVFSDSGRSRRSQLVKACTAPQLRIGHLVKGPRDVAFGHSRTVVCLLCLLCLLNLLCVTGVKSGCPRECNAAATVASRGADGAAEKSVYGYRSYCSSYCSYRRYRSYHGLRNSSLRRQALASDEDTRGIP